MNKKYIYNILAASFQENTVLSAEQQREVLLFFAPKISPKKDDFSFIAQFVAGKKENRTWLQYVYSSGSYIVASDGNAMVWKPTKEYPEGFYCPKTKNFLGKDFKCGENIFKIVFDLDYPDVTKFVSENKRVVLEKTRYLEKITEYPVIPPTKLEKAFIRDIAGVKLDETYTSKLLTREYVHVIPPNVYHDGATKNAVHGFVGGISFIIMGRKV